MRIALAYALLSCGVVNASIVVVDDEDALFQVGTLNDAARVFLDLDGDGTDDVKFLAVNRAFSVGGVTTSIVPTGTGSMIAASSLNRAKPLVVGTEIGSDPAVGGFELWDEGTIPSTGILMESCFSSCFGEWAVQPQVGTRAYVGVMFDAADETHYGWIDVETYGTGFGGTIWRYAYEAEPGVPILAGAIPEPSTLVLGWLATAMFLLHRRR